MQIAIARATQLLRLERGNDRLITVHAHFLVLAIAPWRINDNQRIGRELIALSLQAI